MKLRLIHLIPVYGYFRIRADWFPYQTSVAYHILEIYHAILAVLFLVPLMMAGLGFY